ncbi:hypothetical protein CHOTACABRAS_91 [Bacillus phage Chotacabras]|nr:hypothetical protein CHOTACABRAS_91 [Bacillus phage Chotacabras]
MIYDSLPVYDKELIMVGFNKMQPNNQDSLISTIARKQGTTMWQVRPEDILKYHKELKTSMMDEFSDVYIKLGFTSVNGHRYRLNDNDQINFLGKKDWLRDHPEIEEVPWKTEDSGYVVHTREDWMKVQSEAYTHKETQLFKYNDKVTAIENAKTHEDIVAVTWSGEAPNK